MDGVYCSSDDHAMLRKCKLSSYLFSFSFFFLNHPADRYKYENIA